MSIFDNYLNPTFFLSPLRIANFANFAKNGEKVAVTTIIFVARRSKP